MSNENDPTPSQTPPTNRQYAAIFALAKKLEIDRAAVDGLITSLFSKSGPKELTRDEASSLIATLVGRLGHP